MKLCCPGSIWLLQEFIPNFCSEIHDTWQPEKKYLLVCNACSNQLCYKILKKLLYNKVIVYLEWNGSMHIMISFFQLHLMLNATSTPDKFSVQQKKKKLLHKKTSKSMLDRSVLCPNVRRHIIVRYIEVIKIFIDYFCQAYRAIMWLWLLIGTTVYTLL